MHFVTVGLFREEARKKSSFNYKKKLKNKVDGFAMSKALVDITANFFIKKFDLSDKKFDSAK